MPYPQQQPHGPNYQPIPPYTPIIVTAPPTSGWATASMVLGLLGVLGGWCLFGIPCILAVVAGHVGLAATKDGTRGGRGQAVTGLILGYLFVAPAIVVTILGGIGMVTGDPAPTPTP